MKYVYAALAVLGVLFGLVLLLSAKGAIHEIEAFIIFLIAAVLMACAEVSEVSAELRRARK